MKGSTVFVSKMAVLAVAAVAITASPAWAGGNHDAEAGVAITLHVYDYVQANRATLIAAEGEASRILAAAGVTAHWIDCPTTYSAAQNDPSCPASTSLFDGYIVSILPDAMAVKLPGSAEAWGVAADSPRGPYRAYVFYDRITARDGGDTASADVLVGRVMAREIGSLLLGSQADSRSGLMKARWSGDDLSTLAGMKMLFTPAESRQLRMRLVEEARARQAESQTQIANNGSARNDHQ